MGTIMLILVQVPSVDYAHGLGSYWHVFGFHGGDVALGRELVCCFVKTDVLSATGAVTLVHGGAGPITPDMERSLNARQAGLSLVGALGASSLGESVTLEGAPNYFSKVIIGQSLSRAERIVLGAVLQLEASPYFNAGRGGALQRDGQCRVTAAAMDSVRRRLSGVINVEGIVHPSLLACYLQREDHGLLDAMGATRLLRHLAIPYEDAVTPYQFEVWSSKRRAALVGSDVVADGTGTVGSVCCDAEGRLAAMTSTGGVGFENVGRVGDVPSVAGTYCTERTAVSCTGYGEQIVSHAVAARLAVRLEDAARHVVKGNTEEGESSHPPDPYVVALQLTLDEASRSGLKFAFICVHLHPLGVLWARGMTTERCAWGYAVGPDRNFVNE